MEVAEGFILLQRCLQHAGKQLRIAELEIIINFCVQACEHPQVCVSSLIVPSNPDMFFIYNCLCKKITICLVMEVLVLLTKMLKADCRPSEIVSSCNFMSHLSSPEEIQLLQRLFIE